MQDVFKACDDKESDLEEEISKFYHKKSHSHVSKLMQTFVSGVRTDKLHLVSAMSSDELDGLICRCGSLEKLIRCVAYVLRVAGRAHKKLPHDTIEGLLGAEEQAGDEEYPQVGAQGGHGQAQQL